MSKHEKTEFCVEGRFLGYEFKDGYKIKQLKVATPDAELWIKMTKSARQTLGRTLLPGDLIRVTGMQKRDRETQQLKFKATWIQPITAEIAPFEPGVRSQPKATILMCQKSSCMKKGGKAICRALDTVLAERGLDRQVTVKGTGCMKACGKGPNLVFPGKVRYTQIDAEDIPAIVNEHFAPQPAALEAPVQLPTAV
jgi:(2Fe-2S) ferredoxin